jgi:hypothetical protein
MESMDAIGLLNESIPFPNTIENSGSTTPAVNPLAQPTMVRNMSKALA